jgi:tRNA(Ile2) C34 agmatinyltransferase TiaS
MNQSRDEANRLMEQQHGHNSSHENFHEQDEPHRCDRCGSVLDERDDPDYLCSDCQHELRDREYEDYDE